MNAEEKWHEAERLTREYCAAIKNLGSSFSASAAIADTEQKLVSARATQIQSFEDFQQMIYIQLRMLIDMTEITEEAVGVFLQDLAGALMGPPAGVGTAVAAADAAAAEAEAAAPTEAATADQTVLRFSDDVQNLGPQYSGILAVSHDPASSDPSHVSAALNLATPDVLRQLVSGVIGTAAAGNHWDREDLIHFLADVRFMTAKWLGEHLDKPDQAQ